MNRVADVLYMLTGAAVLAFLVSLDTNDHPYPRLVLATVLMLLAAVAAAWRDTSATPARARFAPSSREWDSPWR